MITCKQAKKQLEEIKVLQQEFDAILLLVKEDKSLTEAQVIKQKLSQQFEHLRSGLDPCLDWQDYKNGQIILHYEGEVDSWFPHPKGIVIRKGKQFFLNGKDLLSEGEWDGLRSRPNGDVVRNGYDWRFYNQSKENKEI